MKHVTGTETQEALKKKPARVLETKQTQSRMEGQNGRGNRLLSPFSSFKQKQRKKGNRTEETE